MDRQKLVTGAIALVIVAAVIAGILFSTRKNRVELNGEILKVRSYQIDSVHTIALVDVRIHNPSTQQFLVREVQAFVDEPDGSSTAADIFTDLDIQRVIDYYPMLGRKENKGLIRRDKINSGQSVDRTVPVNAPMTDDRLGKRKRLRLVIHDTDGPTAEIAERR